MTESIVCEGLPLQNEMGETYGAYTWLVTPYFMASFLVSRLSKPVAV